MITITMKAKNFFINWKEKIVLKIMENNVPVAIPIHAGEIFLLPRKVPHSPQRSANSIGIVIEHYRKPQEKDGFIWFCERCHNKLYETYFELTNIVTQLPKVMQHFYDSQALRTCNNCGLIMQKP